MDEKLPEILDQQLFEHGARGRDAIAKGDCDLAEREFLAAWDVLPEPKDRWDRAPSLARAILFFYRDHRQFQKAELWLGRLRPLLGDSSAAITTMQLLEGSTRYEEGRFDEAFELFGKLYQAYKERPFQGQKPEYLKFYKAKAAEMAKAGGK